MCKSSSRWSGWILKQSTVVSHCKGHYGLNYYLTRMSLFSSKIGRSTESMIDFVVTDMAGSSGQCQGQSQGGAGGDGGQSAQSTISRYACRIMCERSAPYTARIYAAGFDSSKNIFLGVSHSSNHWGSQKKEKRKRKVKKHCHNWICLPLKWLMGLLALSVSCLNVEQLPSCSVRQGNICMRGGFCRSAFPWCHSVISDLSGSDVKG